MASRFAKYQCRCSSCGRTTTRAYARSHGGKCKSCITGVDQPTARSGNEYGNDGYEQWNEEAQRIRLAESGYYGD